MSTSFLRLDDLTGRQRYRLVTSLVVPRPIAWIGSYDGDGRPNLAPFSYFNAVSASPMLLAASVGKRRAPEDRSIVDKDTLRNIRQSEAFSVAVVTDRHLEAMVRTSGDWPYGASEFDAAGLQVGECELVRAPYPVDAPAVFECDLFRIVELGDAPNTLVIGEVRGVRLRPDLRIDPETQHVDAESLRPIGRLGLDEYTLLGELRHVPRPVLPPDPG